MNRKIRYAVIGLGHIAQTAVLPAFRVINAIYESAGIGRAARIEPIPKKRRPDETMEIKRPPVEKPELVATAAPHAG